MHSLCACLQDGCRLLDRTAALGRKAPGYLPGHQAGTCDALQQGRLRCLAAGRRRHRRVLAQVHGHAAARLSRRPRRRSLLVDALRPAAASRRRSQQLPSRAPVRCSFAGGCASTSLPVQCCACVQRQSSCLPYHEGVSVLQVGSGCGAHLGAAPSSAITGAIRTGSKSGLVASRSGCIVDEALSDAESLKLVFAPNWMSISRIATCCYLAAATRPAGDTDIAGRHVSTLNLKPHHTASDLGLLGRGLLLGRLFGGAKVLVAVVVAAVRLACLATLQCMHHSLHSDRPPEMMCALRVLSCMAWR